LNHSLQAAAASFVAALRAGGALEGQANGSGQAHPSIDPEIPTLSPAHSNVSAEVDVVGGGGEYSPGTVLNQAEAVEGVEALNLEKGPVDLSDGMEGVSLGKFFAG
jgi:hypothetical protein